jgi:putative phage-type endonuclease
MLSPKRIGRVTGSAAGAILGLSPYQTADDVLRRMVRDYHGAEPEFVGNVATEYGSFHESGAIIDFEMDTALAVEPNEQFFIHPEHGWLGATPDGFVSDGALIEVKCPVGKRKEGELKPLEAQPGYYAQMQIEMACTGKMSCYFYQWSSHSSSAVIVTYEPEWFERNLPALEAFYQRYLSEIDNPEHLTPRRVIIENHAAQKMIDEYDQLCEAIEFATARKKDVLSELIKMSKERDAEVCGRKLTKVETKGSVSYAKALQKYAPGADLEPFRGKPSTSWRLS